MVAYDLSHLTQPDDQRVCGPIQDDEALFLYSIVRGRRLRTILEIGGLDGYSAANFLRAVEASKDGKVFTVDVNHVPKLAPAHHVIRKDARHLTREDVHGEVIEMVFFDCHDFDAQMHVFHHMLATGLINDDTVLALHDTNTHPTRAVHWAVPTSQGWVHQPVERAMVNAFRALGYEAFLLHTHPGVHDDGALPFRHGVAVCTKVKPLTVGPDV